MEPDKSKPQPPSVAGQATHVSNFGDMLQNLDSSADFPFDNCKLKFVSQFRYLGHKNDNLKDDDDIKGEIKKLLVNTNTLVNRFQRCSHNVKLVLFKSYCMCMYDLALWKYYSVTVYNKFKSAYNKSILKKNFFWICKA